MNGVPAPAAKALCALVAYLALAPAARAQTPPPPPVDESERAIRATAAEVVRLYNNGDAKAIAALFTPNAQILDHEGNLTEGRAAIEKLFAATFAERPNLKMDVFYEQVRLVTPDVAIVDGITKVTAPNEPIADVGRFTTVFVKKDGKWLRDSIRVATPFEPSAADAIRQLDWLIGEWVDEDSNAVVKSNCFFTKDGAAFVREFSVHVEGHEELTGTERVAWDAASKQLVGHVFDSDGSHVTERWSRQGDDWLVKTEKTMPDGRVMSATHVITRKGKDQIVWRTVDRALGGDVLPNEREVVLVRKPPGPKTK